LIAVFVGFSQLPKPTQRQLNWQQLETTGFLHFTVNTFTNKEWGDGTESPSIFNPVKLDARQWIKALKDGGIKMAIITAKHHDGFCLWPSKFTEHSVKNSPWKNGKGDVVKEVADACKEFGLKFGFYLSPWDRHEPSYGTPAYNDHYKNQLRELLTNYGEVSEVWFDGAKGENAKDMQYDFEGYWKLVRELQPKAVMFSDAGPDVRWVGNESGNAGEACWSTIDTTGIAPGKADAAYLNTGDKHGKVFIPAETDVSIRPGWFWHEAENSKVRTPQNIVNLYYQSVGRNSLLLLNVPPNRDGLFEQQDINSLKGFREILDESFRNNLAKNGADAKLTDNDLSTFIILEKNVPLEFKMKTKNSFDRISLQENIANGQSVEQGKIEILKDGQWVELITFSTIGHKRLLRFPAVTASKIRIIVSSAIGSIQLAEVGLYKSSEKEMAAQ
jgi:alpha-L-fucosidase